MRVIRNKIETLKKYVSWAKKLWHPGKRVAYLMGTPVHTNIGDAAIAIAEKHFLSRCGYDLVVDIPTDQVWECARCIRRLLPAKAPVYLLGGGNMGDQYPPEENLRRKVLTEFSAHTMVIFPQTIHYSDGELGKQMEKESIELYKQCSDLTIVARETTSYGKMRQLYPNNQVLLTPDIVLSMEGRSYSQRRNGVLMCLRNDGEKAMSGDIYHSLLHVVRSWGQKVEPIDMIADKPISPALRDMVVETQMKRFSCAELVITDRLHGMVFAALTGTPCIVFRNYNHKVLGTYEWIQYLPYIRYAESVDDVEKYLPELLAMENCEYDNTPLMPYFEKLAEVVKKYAAN